MCFAEVGYGLWFYEWPSCKASKHDFCNTDMWQANLKLPSRKMLNVWRFSTKLLFCAYWNSVSLPTSNSFANLGTVKAAFRRVRSERTNPERLLHVHPYWIFSHGNRHLWQTLSIALYEDRCTTRGREMILGKLLKSLILMPLGYKRKLDFPKLFLPRLAIGEHLL